MTRRARAVVLAIPLAAARAGAQAPDDPQRPISSSIPRVIERMRKEWDAPCEAALAAGIPCFPVWVEAEPPKPSLPESFRDAKPKTAPVPSSAPTHAETLEHLSGTPPLGITFGSFDPVCTGKSLLKSLKGKNDVYYLYRVTDRSGERIALYDRELDLSTRLNVPGVTFEFLGRFDGECEALAAYRRALRAGKRAPGSQR